MQHSLSGDLARFEVPDILTFLHMARATGVLVFERPDQETKLFLHQGQPIYATSTREDLRFGSTLVRVGKLSSPELEAIMARGLGRRARIGELLVEDNVLTSAELTSFLKLQISEVIFDAFDWHEGEFTFIDQVPAPTTAVALEMDLQNLIMEGVRRQDERARLTEIFPDLEMIVEIVANPERVKHTVTFTPEEWQVFFLVNGQRSIIEIVRLSVSLDQPTVLEVLHRLLSANFITLAAHPAVAAEERREAPAAQETPPASAIATTRIRARGDTRKVVNPRAVPLAESGEAALGRRLVLKKDKQETTLALARDTIMIGRHRRNDLKLADPKVSSFHARLEREGNEFIVVDLKSRNGTYVNEERVERRPLRPGDEIRMGATRLLYAVDEVSSLS